MGSMMVLSLPTLGKIMAQHLHEKAIILHASGV